HPTLVPPTATLVRPVTQVPHAPTSTPLPRPTLTPAPSPTPLLFARFQVTPQPLQAICTAGVAAPLTVTLTNAGNAQVNWQAATYVTTSTGTMPQGWAQLTPANGTLAPNASAAITLTPGASFCAATSETFIVQFAAADGLAVPLNVTVTHT